MFFKQKKSLNPVRSSVKLIKLFLEVSEFTLGFISAKTRQYENF